MKFHIDGYHFEAADMREEILIDPVLPAGFDHMPNNERPASHDKFWNRPFIDTRNNRDSGFVTVRCLDGGAWDRSTVLGRFPTIEDALRQINEGERQQEVESHPAFYAFGIGGPSPYPSLAQGATLDIGPGGLTLVVSLPSPSKQEVRAIRQGQLDIGMMMVGSTAVLLWRFPSPAGQEEGAFRCRRAGASGPDRLAGRSGDMPGVAHGAPACRNLRGCRHRGGGAGQAGFAARLEPARLRC